MVCSEGNPLATGPASRTDFKKRLSESKLKADAIVKIEKIEKFPWQEMAQNPSSGNAMTAPGYPYCLFLQLKSRTGPSKFTITFKITLCRRFFLFFNRGHTLAEWR